MDMEDELNLYAGNSITVHVGDREAHDPTSLCDFDVPSLAIAAAPSAAAAVPSGATSSASVPSIASVAAASAASSVSVPSAAAPSAATPLAADSSIPAKKPSERKDEDVIFLPPEMKRDYFNPYGDPFTVRVPELLRKCFDELTLYLQWLVADRLSRESRPLYYSVLEKHLSRIQVVALNDQALGKAIVNLVRIRSKHGIQKLMVPSARIKFVKSKMNGELPVSGYEEPPRDAEHCIIIYDTLDAFFVDSESPERGMSLDGDRLLQHIHATRPFYRLKRSAAPDMLFKIRNALWHRSVLIQDDPSSYVNELVAAFEYHVDKLFKANPTSFDARFSPAMAVHVRQVRALLNQAKTLPKILEPVDEKGQKVNPQEVLVQAIEEHDPSQNAEIPAPNYFGRVWKPACAIIGSRFQVPPVNGNLEPYKKTVDNSLPTATEVKRYRWNGETSQPEPEKPHFINDALGISHLDYLFRAYDMLAILFVSSICNPRNWSRLSSAQKRAIHANITRLYKTSTWGTEFWCLRDPNVVEEKEVNEQELERDEDEKDEEDSEEAEEKEEDEGLSDPVKNHEPAEWLKFFCGYESEAYPMTDEEKAAFAEVEQRRHDFGHQRVVKNPKSITREVVSTLIRQMRLVREVLQRTRFFGLVHVEEQDVMRECFQETSAWFEDSTVQNYFSFRNRLKVPNTKHLNLKAWLQLILKKLGQRHAENPIVRCLAYRLWPVLDKIRREHESQVRPKHSTKLYRDMLNANIYCLGTEEDEEDEVEEEELKEEKEVKEEKKSTASVNKQANKPGGGTGASVPKAKPKRKNRGKKKK